MCHRLEALLKVFKEKKLRSYPASRDEPAVSSALEWTPDNTAAALKGCAFDQHLGLKLYHEDPLPLIESACALAGCQFLDHEFLVHPSATVSIAGSLGLAPGIITNSNAEDLGGSGDSKRMARVEEFVDRAAKRWRWVRGHSLGHYYSLFSSPKSIDARNVIQGQVGNCGFCSGFSSLALFPDLIATALKANKTCGAVSVRLFPKGGGVGWERWLLMDDFVIVNKFGKESPSLHSLVDGDLWIRFLEKVFVKIQSSYASLDGFYKYNSLYRHPGRALGLLTGGFAFEMNHEGGRECFAALVATQAFCCARVAHCREASSGLYSNHGYSLLWIGEVCDGLRLCCLRNPHGRRSFTGRFGWGVDSWNGVDDEVIEALLEVGCFFEEVDGAAAPVEGGCLGGKVKSTSGNRRVVWQGGRAGASVDDGVFLIEFDVFARCFPILTIVNIFDGGPVLDNHNVVRKLEPGDVHVVPELLELLASRR